jgi:hypothetical protein
MNERINLSHPSFDYQDLMIHRIEVIIQFIKLFISPLNFHCFPLLIDYFKEAHILLSLLYHCQTLSPLGD